jgi:hypothetical protein
LRVHSQACIFPSTSQLKVVLSFHFGISARVLSFTLYIAHGWGKTFDDRRFAGIGAAALDRARTNFWADDLSWFSIRFYGAI